MLPTASHELPDLLFYSGPSRQLSAVRRIEGIASHKSLHQGGIGEVFRGCCTADGDYVGVKRYNSVAAAQNMSSKRVRSESLVQREAVIGMSLDHPNVVRTHGYKNVSPALAPISRGDILRLSSLLLWPCGAVCDTFS